MVDHDLARETCHNALRPMRHALWLGQWKIDLHYGRLEEHAIGMCTIDLPHQVATITIDYEAHETVSELLDTLRHELLHVVIAYIEHPRTLAHQFIQGDAFNAVDAGFQLAHEHSVKGMERFMDACGLSPARLIEVGRANFGE